jgi:hypothetical protein
MEKLEAEEACLLALVGEERENELRAYWGGEFDPDAAKAIATGVSTRSRGD